MNVHEYQAKQLLRERGIWVPDGRLARSPDEAEAAARAIGGDVVVKAQIHAGGRGKAGGIVLVHSPSEARAAAEALIGKTLTTPQTGAAGKLVRRLYVEAAAKIDRELYLGITIDRAAQRAAIIASTEGGVEIEQVAEATPDKITTVSVDPLVGLCEYQARDLGLALELNPAQTRSFVELLAALYDLFLEKDASLVEVNPLVVSDDRVFPLDCKLGFDTNALYRHPEIAELRDPDEEDARELEAEEYGLSWVSLDGEIGCMVNGAGLAMATMDIIALAGSKPANFLDVGGTADAERVSQAFRLILADPNVKAILVNIFGGIVRCDLVAEGVIQAATTLGVDLPMVVRLDGTNAERAKEMLRGSGLGITSAEGMADAAEKVVAAVRA